MSKHLSFIIILSLLSSYCHADVQTFNSDNQTIIIREYQPSQSPPPPKPAPDKLNLKPDMSFQQKEQEIDRFFNYGRRLFKEKKYAQALPVYHEVLIETEKLYSEYPDRFKSRFNHMMDIHLQLAGYYRWKEGDQKKAIEEYKALLLTMDEFNSDDRRNHAVLFLMGEIYEKELRQYEKARDCYQKVVDQLKSEEVKGQEAMFMKSTLDWYAFLVDKIDVLYLKKSRQFPPRTLKYPSVEYSYFLSFFVNAMAFSTLSFIGEDFMNNATDYYSIEAMNGLMEKYPTSYQMMFFGINLFYEFLEQKEIEKAMIVADKLFAAYPSDINMAMLQFQIADIYKEQGDKAKRKSATKKGLKMAKALNIDMILGVDERFSDPDKTWQIFKTALGKKDVEEAVSCFSPTSQDRYRQLFTAMKDNLDKMAADMKPIDKVQEDEGRVKFRIHRTQNGHEITYYIYFVNVLGEWKIDQF